MCVGEGVSVPHRASYRHGQPGYHLCDNNICVPSDFVECEQVASGSQCRQGRGLACHTTHARLGRTWFQCVLHPALLLVQQIVLHVSCSDNGSVARSLHAKQHPRTSLGKRAAPGSHEDAHASTRCLRSRPRTSKLSASCLQALGRGADLLELPGQST